jgi:hypothetical protein
LRKSDRDWVEFGGSGNQSNNVAICACAKSSRSNARATVAMPDIFEANSTGNP